jgi:hypothetical protein
MEMMREAEIADPTSKVNPPGYRRVDDEHLKCVSCGELFWQKDPSRMIKYKGAQYYTYRNLQDLHENHLMNGCPACGHVPPKLEPGVYKIVGIAHPKIGGEWECVQVLSADKDTATVRLVRNLRLAGPPFTVRLGLFNWSPAPLVIPQGEMPEPARETQVCCEPDCFD